MAVSIALLLFLQCRDEFFAQNSERTRIAIAIQNWDCQDGSGLLGGYASTILNIDSNFNYI